MHCIYPWRCLTTLNGSVFVVITVLSFIATVYTNKWFNLLIGCAACNLHTHKRCHYTMGQHATQRRGSAVVIHSTMGACWAVIHIATWGEMMYWKMALYLFCWFKNSFIGETNFGVGLVGPCEPFAVLFSASIKLTYFAMYFRLILWNTTASTPKNTWCQSWRRWLLYFRRPARAN